MVPPLVLLGSYLLGSLPFGLLIARWWAGIDVREHGSGNIGATNVYRVVSKPAGAVVFILDVLKGWVPPVVAARFGLNEWWIVGAGFAAIMGHSYSPFLGFKGGKGVSTGLGALLGIAWKVALVGWTVWAIVLGVSGYVSLGSILAAAAIPLVSWLFHPGDSARLAFCMAAGIFSIYKHLSNIRRLRAGTELGFRNKGHEQERADEEKGRPAI